MLNTYFIPRMIYLTLFQKVEVDEYMSGEVLHEYASILVAAAADSKHGILISCNFR
jgi:hypothetical protein